MIKLSVQFERFWNELKSKMGIAHGFASLDAEGRIPYSQLPESAMEYKGKWDAETNTPDLNQPSLKVNGSFYIVSVPGTFEGVEYRENDRIVYDSEEEEWQRLPAGAVSSVNGMTGPVVLTAEDIRMSGMDDATVYDNLMKMIAATGNVAYKTYQTYAQMMAGEDFAQLPNGIYIYVVAQDENYPRQDQPGYFYTTIYSYLAYRDESTSGITDWDTYEWDTETVQEQSEMDGEYFMTGNLATGTTATASTGNASLAVDGNLDTRWESAQEDPQWIAVDLGKKQIVESIGFLWETASAAEYEIQFSNDGEEWTTVQKCSGSTINVKEYRKITLQNPSLVRHVRMYGNTRTTPYGYSIYELGVYGKGSSGTLQLVGKLSTNFMAIGSTVKTQATAEDRSLYLAMVKDNNSTPTPEEVKTTGSLNYNPVSRTLTIAGDDGAVANIGMNEISLSMGYKKGRVVISKDGITLNPGGGSPDFTIDPSMESTRKALLCYTPRPAGKPESTYDWAYGPLTDPVIYPGILTSSKTGIQFTVHVDKSLENIGRIELKQLRTNIRIPEGGYLPGPGYVNSGFNWMTSAGGDFSWTCKKLTDHDILIDLKVVVPWGSGTNNSPLAVATHQLAFNFWES